MAIIFVTKWFVKTPRNTVVGVATAEEAYKISLTLAIGVTVTPAAEHAVYEKIRTKQSVNCQWHIAKARTKLTLAMDLRTYKSWSNNVSGVALVHLPGGKFSGVVFGIEISAPTTSRNACYYLTTFVT